MNAPDSRPSKEVIATCVHGRAQHLCRLCLKADIARVESAHAAILAENTHYKKEAQTWKDATHAWIAANNPGGWIDDLRRRATHEPPSEQPSICDCTAYGGGAHTRSPRCLIVERDSLQQRVAELTRELADTRDAFLNQSARLVKASDEPPATPASKAQCREQFDMWAETLGLCMDELFMSSTGVPENPFEDQDTKSFYMAWLAAWEACDALRSTPPPIDARQALKEAGAQIYGGRWIDHGDECNGEACVCGLSDWIRRYASLLGVDISHWPPVTKSERCSECRELLPPLATWSMPACPACVDKADRATESGKRAYQNSLDPSIHSNRYPAWDELTPEDREGWIRRAAGETSGPASLVGALQDVVHTDPGPVRTGRSVRSGETSTPQCEICFNLPPAPLGMGRYLCQTHEAEFHAWKVQKRTAPSQPIETSTSQDRCRCGVLKSEHPDGTSRECYSLSKRT